MLPKENRLERYQEIERIKKEGKLYQSSLFGLIVLARPESKNSRFCFIVSLKVARRATRRNRTKRLFAEAIKSWLAKISPGFDLIFLGKKAIIDRELVQIKEEMGKALAKAGLLTKD